MDPSDARFAGSRCVVFGATGFLGSHVAGALVASGADVVGFDLREPRIAFAGCSHVTGDITDPAAVRSVVGGSDNIFAFAGGSGAVRSLADPLTDLHTSCEAQLILLESVREAAPGASVVFPGSRLQYGRATALPVAEDHPLRGASPYALDKSEAADLYHTAAERDGLHAVVLRLPNPYGAHAPGGFARSGYGVLNGFIDTALGGGTIPLYGGGEQLRDFVHVDDVSEAAMAAALTPEAAGLAINIGSGEGVSLRRAAELVIEACGRGSLDTEASWPEEAAAVETGDFYFDVSLASKVLGWTPEVTLEDGVRALVAAALSA
jgi:UDP-glucose 4-epimerase